jgi:hypothetical protein
MALSRDQRNQVLRRIEARALSRDDFRWDDATTGNRTVVGPVEHHALVHRATGVLFTFKSQPSEFEAPPNGIVLAGRADVGVARINVIDGWPKQMDGFSEWLERLKAELDVPDLWAELRHDDRAVFTVVADPSAENTPFTEDEREEIARVLAELTAEVKDSFALTADSIKLLDAGVAQLIDDSQRIGRKDWLLLFIGVMVSIAVTAAIPHLLPALLAAFGHLRHLFAPRPLTLPPP